MSFFDDFKRSATDAANKAAKKTGELTNIAKLNYNLSNYEKKLSNVYCEIGKMFYKAQRMGEDHTSAIASAIMKADKIISDMENCKAEIAKLKNASICPNCGKEVPEEAAFCSGCGTKIERPVEVPEEKPENECSCEDDSECDCGESCECENECDCDESRECGDDSCECDGEETKSDEEHE